MEESHSGRVQRFTKPPYRKVSWVQIPPPPPKNLFLHGVVVYNLLMAKSHTSSGEESISGLSATLEQEEQQEKDVMAYLLTPKGLHAFATEIREWSSYENSPAEVVAKTKKYAMFASLAAGTALAASNAHEFNLFTRVVVTNFSEALVLSDKLRPEQIQKPIVNSTLGIKLADVLDAAADKLLHFKDPPSSDKEKTE